MNTWDLGFYGQLKQGTLPARLFQLVWGHSVHFEKTSVVNIFETILLPHVLPDSKPKFIISMLALGEYRPFCQSSNLHDKLRQLQCHKADTNAMRELRKNLIFIIFILKYLLILLKQLLI